MAALEWGCAAACVLRNRVRFEPWSTRMPPDDNSGAMLERLVDLPDRPHVGANFIAGSRSERGRDHALGQGNFIDVVSPYTGQLLGRIPDSTPSELDDAVQAAKAAAVAWAA